MLANPPFRVDTDLVGPPRMMPREGCRTVEVGWYKSKSDPTRARYFDGTQWTDQYRDLRAPTADNPSSPQVEQSQPGAGVAEPIAAEPVVAEPQARVLSPDGMYFWDGTQWMPTPELLEAQAFAAQHDAQMNERAELARRRNRIVLSILLVGLLVSIGLFVMMFLPLFKNGVPSMTLDASVPSMTSDAKAYARQLDSMYAKSGQFPTAAELEAVEYAGTSPGNTVYIAYKDDDWMPASPEDATEYVICVANAEKGRAMLYDTTQMGLNGNVYEAGDSIDACIETAFSTGMSFWDPLDVSIIDDGASKTDIPVE